MRGLFLVLLLAGVAFGQYTVTVTATQTLNVQPDQALIGGYLETGVTGSFGDVLNTLQPAGITAANLNGITTVNGGFTPNPNAIVWSFTLAVPLASLNSTLTALAQLQQKISQPNTGLNNLYFAVQGLQVSPQLQAAQQCPIAALVTSAQSQAIALAQAAGFGIGPLLAISDGSVGAYSATPAAIAIASFTGQPFALTQCTVVAQFSLVPAA